MKRLILGVLLVALIVVGVQITVSANGGRPLSADLSGASEVPAGSGDPDGTGSANVTLNQGQGEICWEITVQNISTVVLAHIHAAPAGANGPIVVDFNGQLSGCVSGVSIDLIKDIRQNPENYYVNIHSSKFRRGAVRGQLSK